MKWGIECVREGCKLQEHIDRFREGGRYYPWIASGQMLRENYKVVCYCHSLIQLFSNGANTRSSSLSMALLCNLKASDEFEKVSDYSRDELVGANL